MITVLVDFAVAWLPLRISTEDTCTEIPDFEMTCSVINHTGVWARKGYLNLKLDCTSTRVLGVVSCVYIHDMYSSIGYGGRMCFHFQRPGGGTCTSTLKRFHHNPRANAIVVHLEAHSID